MTIAICAAASVIMTIAVNLGQVAVQRSHPELLRRTATFSPAAAAYAAEAELAGNRLDNAIALATAALRMKPLMPRALRILALAAEERGNGEQAANAMTFAGALGWRDTPTQLWLIEAFARQGDYASALSGMDALLRRRQHEPTMIAFAIAAALEPAARLTLIERLAQQPEWRPRFVAAAYKLPPEQFGAFEEFLSGMKASGVALQQQEAVAFVSKVYEAGQYRRAAQVWRRHGARDRAADNEIFDGDFAQATLETRARSPFEWRFPEEAGGEAALDIAPGRSSERALHASSNGNARFLAATQALALNPGRYSFSLDATAEPKLRLAGFSWIVECRSGPSPAMAEQRRQLPDSWSRIIYTFSIAGACKGQRLKLFLHSGQPQPLSLWFDRLTLRKAGAEMGQN